MRILVTGAGGFVGGPVCRTLLAAGHAVAASVRRPTPLPAGVEPRPVGELGPDTDWSAALSGIDAVVHLAARAHVMAETAADPLAIFRHVNRDGTLRLAEAAAAAGIRRMVFVSSIKVNGESTPPDRPFHAEDAPAPADPYGVSKAEAEAALAALGARTGLATTVLRPPLVHGPGAKGNLLALMRLLRRRLPLPLGAIHNRRSLLGVDNLAGAIAFCLAMPATAGGTFLLRDGEDVSTPALLRRLGRALGCPSLLLPVPPALLRGMAGLAGRSAAVDRLAGSLVVDDTPLRRLGWRPVLDLDSGLEVMARAFHETCPRRT